MRGVASNRKMARVGFAATFTQSLIDKTISFKDAMKSLDDPTVGAQFLKTSGTMGKADRTHTLIGQLFFSSAIARAMEKTGESSLSCLELKKFANFCIVAFNSKPLLRQMACSVLEQVINCVELMEDVQTAKDAVFKVIEPILRKNWRSSQNETDAADLLLLACVSEKVIPSNFLAENGWCDVSEESSSKSFIQQLLNEPATVAAAIASARQTPFIHIAAPKIIEKLVAKAGAKKKYRKLLEKFWHEFVEERLLLPTSPSSYKIAAIQLGLVVITGLMKETPTLLPIVLTGKFTELLASSLRRKLCKEHESTLAFFEKLTAIFAAHRKSSIQTGVTVESEEDFYLQVLLCLMNPPMKVWADYPSKFDKLLHAAPPTSIAKFVEIMKQVAANGSYSMSDGEEVKWPDENTTLAARRWAIMHLATSLPLCMQAQSKDDVIDTMKIVVTNCLLDNDGESKENLTLFPHEQSVNMVLRIISAATTSHGAQHHLCSNASDCIELMKPVVSLIKQNMEKLTLPLGENGQEAFTSLTKITKKKTEPDSVQELLKLFACHCAVLLPCHPKDEEILQLSGEIKDLFVNTSESDQEGPVRVFLDMLVGLLSRKSKPIRQLTTGMYGRLIENDKLLALLTTARNVDSSSQVSSLVDLIVNALVNTQFVEDDDENDGDDDDDDDDDDDESDDDGGESEKKKSNVTGHVVSSTADPVQNDGENEDNEDTDGEAMDDEDMFKMDAVFANAVKQAQGPAKKAKKDKKNKQQQMKEFHMKLVSWLDMLIHRSEKMQDGSQILVDIVGVLMNHLSNKKKSCSHTIEDRFCLLVKQIFNFWLNLKDKETIERAAGCLLAKFNEKSGVAPSEFILDSVSTFVKSPSTTAEKFLVAANAVEVLLIFSATDSSAVKTKTIVAICQNLLDAYLAHPSPLGHLFFASLLASKHIELKKMDRIFTERLLNCIAGQNAKPNASPEREDDDQTSVKSEDKMRAKTFPRSQAARLLAGSQVVTSKGFLAIPKIREQVDSVLLEVVSKLSIDIEMEHNNVEAQKRYVLK